MTPRRKFRFIQELAAGGFGKVYLAEMVTGENFSSVVAIKLLLSEWADNDEIVQRARDEARMLGRLRHRNIVRVEDLTVLQGHCAVVMEYLEGVDCKSLINYFEDGSNGDMPLQSMFEVIGNVASALDAAYNHVPLQGGEAMQLVHRDIKPSNVMVTLGGDVKLLDFGTARANFEEREAKTQQLAFGSQAYMAPERFLGDEDTPATDVYSLGVTLYELIKKENYGRIDLRPAKYNALVVERIGSLDFGDVLPPEIADQARAAIAAMISYGCEERPSAAQVVELMDVLSEEANDGSLRRFARRHVKDVMACNNHTPDPDDPLTGSTLFEDRSTGFYANTESEGLDAADSGADEAPGPPSLTMPDPSEEFKSLDEVSDELQEPEDLVPSVSSSTPPAPAAVTFLPAEERLPHEPEPAPEPVAVPSPPPVAELNLGGATERMEVPEALREPPEPPAVKSAQVQSSFRPAEIYEPEDPEPSGKSKLPMMFGAAMVLLLLGAGVIVMLPGGEEDPAPAQPIATTLKAPSKTDTKADTSTDSKADTKSETKADTKADTKSETKADTKSETKADTKSETKADTSTDSKADEPATEETTGTDAQAAVDPDDPDAPEETAAATGGVSLKVLPFGSKVSVVGNGKSLSFKANFGQPPKAYSDLPAGSYRATVTRTTDGKKVTKSFTVRAGQSCDYEFNMESYQNGWTGSCK